MGSSDAIILSQSLLPTLDFEVHRDSLFHRLSGLSSLHSLDETTRNILINLTGILLTMRSPSQLKPFALILDGLPAFDEAPTRLDPKIQLAIRQLIAFAQGLAAAYGRSGHHTAQRLHDGSPMCSPAALTQAWSDISGEHRVHRVSSPSIVPQSQMSSTFQQSLFPPRLGVTTRSGAYDPYESHATMSTPLSALPALGPSSVKTYDNLSSDRFTAPTSKDPSWSFDYIPPTAAKAPGDEKDNPSFNWTEDELSKFLKIAAVTQDDVVNSRKMPTAAQKVGPCKRRRLSSTPIAHRRNQVIPASRQHSATATSLQTTIRSGRRGRPPLAGRIARKSVTRHTQCLPMNGVERTPLHLKPRERSQRLRGEAERSYGGSPSFHQKVDLDWRSPNGSDEGVESSDSSIPARGYVGPLTHSTLSSEMSSTAKRLPSRSAYSDTEEGAVNGAITQKEVDASNGQDLSLDSNEEELVILEVESDSS